jgi:TonB family protein
LRIEMVGWLLLFASALFPAIYQQPQTAPEPQPRAVDWQVERSLRVSAEPAVYPPIAQMGHVEGSVRVQFVVGTDGTTKDLTYLSGPPLLMGAALNSIRTWRFKPTIVSGVPVEVETVTSINFFLGKDNVSSFLAPYRKSAEKHPNDVKEQVALGAAMVTVGEVDDAIVVFRRAISLQPEDPSQHLGLANAFASKGDVDSAIGEYRLGISLAPNNAEAHYNFSNLLERKGDLDSAIAEYRLGLQLDPKDARRRSDLGALLIKRGDLDGAIEELRLALHQDHEIPSAHYQLGRALEKKGDMDAALKEYKKAAIESPNVPEFKEAVARLSANRKS